MILVLVLCAATLSANTGWGHEVYVQFIFLLGAWVSVTLIIETFALSLARPVRVLQRYDVSMLQRAGWSYLLLVVLLMNVVSGALGTLASYLVAITVGSKDYVGTSLILVVLTHLTASVIIEAFVVSRMLVFTGGVFVAVLAGNLISYLTPVGLFAVLVGW